MDQKASGQGGAGGRSRRFVGGAGASGTRGQSVRRSAASARHLVSPFYGFSLGAGSSGALGCSVAAPTLAAMRSALTRAEVISDRSPRNSDFTSLTPSWIAETLAPVELVSPVKVVIWSETLNVLVSSAMANPINNVIANPPAHWMVVWPDRSELTDSSKRINLATDSSAIIPRLPLSYPAETFNRRASSVPTIMPHQQSHRASVPRVRNVTGGACKMRASY
jgi:hypothetical protein